MTAPTTTADQWRVQSRTPYGWCGTGAPVSSQDAARRLIHWLRETDPYPGGEYRIVHEVTTTRITVVEEPER